MMSNYVIVVYVNFLSWYVHGSHSVCLLKPGMIDDHKDKSGGRGAGKVHHEMGEKPNETYNRLKTQVNKI
jgi:hypothetical protein